MKTPYYYNVAVALDAIWQEATYTYKSEEKISSGAVVIVPFGRDKKPGYIVKETEKPDFTTKNITSITSVLLPEKSTELYEWMQKFYPGSPGVQLQYQLPSLLKTKLPDSIEEKPAAIKKQKHPLTPNQSDALQQIEQDNKPVVLQGITGSGKTRLYCEVAKQYIEAGQDVLLIYPEISLTRQTKKVIADFYGTHAVSAYHSKQAMSAQRKTWLRALTNATDKGRVFIGPRSALFLPLSRVGLIIIDEAHDSAYKQDSGIRYNGLLVAAALAGIHGAKLVLGSATPPVQETHQILNKGGSLVVMNQLAKPSSTVRKFDVLDMTNKNNRSKTSYLLSKKLIQATEKALKNNQQTLLFLNRRGTARMLLCEDCGWHASCKNCDMPLIYHHDSHSTKCHICGMQSKAYVSCPDCNNTLTQKTPGTKAIEADIAALFPDASVARFDSDNNKAESFSEQYEKVASGEIDIIIGTQLLTKGLDLPNLSTVGILQADSALLLPDYTSEERAFQQLVQVSGRVGRGHVNEAHVILQTYQPSHRLFEYVCSHDWKSFYNSEIKRREESGYPPHRYAMRIWSIKNTVTAAEAACSRLADQLRSVQGLSLMGPAPSFYEKRAGKYSWQLVLLSPSRKQLAQIAATLPKDVFYDLDPVSLL